MAEEKIDPRDKPSFIVGLKEKIKAGKTVHEVIGEVLRYDAQRLYSFHEKYLLAQGSDPKNPLDEDLINRYELRPPNSPELSDLNLPKNLSFVGGFSYVASHFYPTLERASKPQSSTTSSTPPIEAGLLEHLRKETQDSILRELQSQSLVDEAMVDEVREKLIADPSGETWLTQEAREEFREGNLELTGALKAIHGARKLFDTLIS